MDLAQAYRALVRKHFPKRASWRIASMSQLPRPSAKSLKLRRVFGLAGAY
jgi:hypothetical protein